MRKKGRLPYAIVASTAATLLGFLLLGPRSMAADETRAENKPPGTIEFIGKNLVSTAEGVFHDWRIEELSVDLEALEQSFAVVVVELSSLDTGIERRDEHLRNPDFFDVEKYPVATVRIHSARPLDVAADAEPRFAVRFDIDLHGVKKSLDGEVVLTGTNPITFEGDLLIDRLEFGIGEAPGFWRPMTPKVEIPVHFRVEI